MVDRRTFLQVWTSTKETPSRIGPGSSMLYRCVASETAITSSSVLVQQVGILGSASLSEVSDLHDLGE